MTRRGFLARVIGAAVAMTVPWESALVKKRYEARIVQTFGRRMSKAEWMELEEAIGQFMRGHRRYFEMEQQA